MHTYLYTYFIYVDFHIIYIYIHTIIYIDLNRGSPLSRPERPYRETSVLTDLVRDTTQLFSITDAHTWAFSENVSVMALPMFKRRANGRAGEGEYTWFCRFLVENTVCSGQYLRVDMLEMAAKFGLIGALPVQEGALLCNWCFSEREKSRAEFLYKFNYSRR